MMTQALISGGLIGLASGLLLVVFGRILGISGIVGMSVNLLSMPSTPEQRQRELGWRLWFLAGLLAGGIVLTNYFPSAAPQQNNTSFFLLIVAGLLVGFGTRMGLGCTSGHGICGIGRLSGRSLVATLIFIIFGMIAASLLRGVL